MANRKPYNLTYIIRCYNIFQIVACSLFIWRMNSLGVNHKNTWKCVGTDGEFTKDLMELNRTQWYFTILRLIEFVETFFFVLRKRFDQVSWLHVYHHISTVVLLIIFLKYSGGVMDIYIGGLNSLVHIVMYGYYFLSSFEQFRRLTNIVKSYLTMIQIAQLVIILGHCITAVQPTCKTVHFVYYLQIINICLLLTMFVNFYVRSFVKRKQK